MTDQAQPEGNYYDKYRASNPLVRWMMGGFLCAFDQLVARSGAGDAHEIGCGEGHLTLRLARSGLAVLACDIAQSCVEETRAAAEKAGLDIPVRQSSLYDLRAPEDSAALVVCCEVLEHLPDPRRAVDLLADLAAPYLLASVPREPLWRLLNLCRGAYIAAAGNTPGHVQHWSSTGFAALLGQRFDIVELRHPLPWTMALCRKR
jgi:SAM-dependent methyltransferase